MHRRRTESSMRSRAHVVLRPSPANDILQSSDGGLMQSFTRLGFVVVISIAVVLSSGHVAAQKQATTTMTRLYTGTDGQSHAEDTAIAWRPAKLRAELNETESVKVTSAQFLRWPRGFVWEGHPASKRQYVIIVSGRGEVDVVGGKKIQLAPGRVLLAEDVAGKGHARRRRRRSGDAPATARPRAIVTTRYSLTALSE